MKKTALSRRHWMWLSAPLWLGLQACANPASPPSEPTAPLWGTQWQLQALGGEPVIAGKAATLQFPEPGKIAGNGSCNRFFGTVSIEGNQIEVGPLGSTKMACAGGAMAQESRYLGALQKALRVERQDNTLLIHTQGMSQPLRFVRLP